MSIATPSLQITAALGLAALAACGTDNAGSRSDSAAPPSTQVVAAPTPDQANATAMPAAVAVPKDPAFSGIWSVVGEPVLKTDPRGNHGSCDHMTVNYFSLTANRGGSVTVFQTKNGQGNASLTFDATREEYTGKVPLIKGPTGDLTVKVSRNGQKWIADVLYKGKYCWYGNPLELTLQQQADAVPHLSPTRQDVRLETAISGLQEPLGTR